MERNDIWTNYQTGCVPDSLTSVLSEQGGRTVGVVVTDSPALVHTVARLTAGTNVNICTVFGPNFAFVFSLDDLFSPERDLSASSLVHEVSLGYSTSPVESAISINIFSKSKKRTWFSRSRFLCNVILEKQISLIRFIQISNEVWMNVDMDYHTRHIDITQTTGFRKYTVVQCLLFCVTN